MSDTTRILKNTTFLIIGNNISKVLSFVILIILARYLGVSDYGAYAFALGFAGIFILLTDFGISNYTQREIARFKDRVNHFTSMALLNKLVLAGVGLLIVVLISNLLGYTAQTRMLIYLSMYMLILQSLTTTFTTAFRAYEKMQLSAIVLIVRVLMRLLFVGAAILLAMKLETILLAFIIASAIGLLVGLFLYNRYITPFNIPFSKRLAKQIIIKAIPFGTAGVLMTLYTKIDLVMLSKLVTQNTDTIIGYYSSAYTLIEGVEFIPIAIAGALYPIAARAFLTSLPKLRKLFKKAQLYFMLIAFPMTVGVAVLAEKIILLIFGETYLPATGALVILVWSWLFYFQMYSIGLALDNMNKEKITMMATIITLVMNVAANAILIPMFSYLGAAIATVISQATYMAIGYFYVNKYLTSVFAWKPFMKITIISAIMGGALLLLPRLPLVIAIILGIVLYVGGILTLKVVPQQDLRELWELIVRGRMLLKKKKIE